MRNNRIFIGGCARSGTTFLASLLARSTEYASCWHESPFLEAYLSKFDSLKKYPSSQLFFYLILKDTKFGKTNCLFLKNNYIHWIFWI